MYVYCVLSWSHTKTTCHLNIADPLRKFNVMRVVYLRSIISTFGFGFFFRSLFLLEREQVIQYRMG